MSMMKRKKQVLGGTIGVVVALGLVYYFGPRPLNAKVGASSVSLVAVEADAEGLILQKKFLEAVERIELLRGGGGTPERMTRISGGLLDGRVALGPAGCNNLRFEGARCADRKSSCVSLHVEPQSPPTDCSLPVKGLGDAAGRPVTLHANDRLDCVLRRDKSSATAERSLEVLGAASMNALDVSPVGKIDGFSEDPSCELGKHVKIAGPGLQIGSLMAQIGPDIPRFEVWARTRLPTRFDVDGSRCAVALYAPKWLLPTLLIAGLAAAGWKVASWL